MKDIGTIIYLPKNEGAELKIREDGAFSLKLSEKIAITAAANVDNAIIKAMYEAYKHTDASKAFILDLGQFERFLKEMLPKWREENQ